MRTAKNAGFTLIELMVVLIIVGIIAGLGYPAYQDQVSKSRRAEAISILQDYALQQERWRANDTDYASMAELGVPTSSDYYDFTLENVGTSTYTLVATAKGAQTHDASCTPLRLDQSNQKTPVNCW